MTTEKIASLEALCWFPTCVFVTREILAVLLTVCDPIWLGMFFPLTPSACNPKALASRFRGHASDLKHLSMVRSC